MFFTLTLKMLLLLQLSNFLTYLLTPALHVVIKESSASELAGCSDKTQQSSFKTELDFYWLYLAKTDQLKYSWVGLPTLFLRISSEHLW